MSGFARAAAALGLCAAAACGGGGVKKVYPEIHVKLAGAELADGATIDFGGVPVLNAKELALDVTNAGRADLDLASADATDQTGSFSAKPLASKKVKPGGTARVTAVFTPQAQGPATGTLVINSDDRTHPKLTFNLTGTGTTVGCLDVAPASLDFGVVAEATQALKRLTLTSCGTADLIVQSIQMKDGSDPAFGFVGSVATPATLAAPQGGNPGQSVDIAVAFAPTGSSPRTAAGTVVIGSTDPNHRTFEIPVTATVNHAPIADAGGDRDAAPLDSIVLDGSKSTDPDGDLPLAWDWTLVSQPANSQATIQGADTANPKLWLDLAGEYVVSLNVYDSLGLESVRPSVAHIRAVPADKLYAELVWADGYTDLDLHLINTGHTTADLGTKDDCFYLNPTPDWGVAGVTADDPRLLRDDLAGYGPEIISYPNPPDGTYTWAVVYYASHGYTQPVDARLRIYSYGVLVADIGHALASQGQVWTVATVDWPSGVVTTVDSVSP